MSTFKLLGIPKWGALGKQERIKELQNKFKGMSQPEVQAYLEDFFKSNYEYREGVGGLGSNFEPTSTTGYHEAMKLQARKFIEEDLLIKDKEKRKK